MTPLEQTLLHLPHIGPKRAAQLIAAGCDSWQAILAADNPLGMAAARWAAVVERVEHDDPPLWGVIAAARPVSWNGSGLTLAFATDVEANLARGAAERIGRAAGDQLQITVGSSGTIVSTTTMGRKTASGTPSASLTAIMLALPPVQDADRAPNPPQNCPPTKWR